MRFALHDEPRSKAANRKVSLHNANPVLAEEEEKKEQKFLLGQLPRASGSRRGETCLMKKMNVNVSKVFISAEAKFVFPPRIASA